MERCVGAQSRKWRGFSARGHGRGILVGQREVTGGAGQERRRGSQAATKAGAPPQARGRPLLPGGPCLCPAPLLQDTES